MNIRTRVTAANKFSGPFVDEIQGLDVRASRVHLVVVGLVTFLSLALMYKFFVSPYWLPSVDENTLVVDRVSVQYANDRRQELSLPHRMSLLGHRDTVLALTSHFELDHEPAPNSAIYIPIHFNRLKVSLNGHQLLPSYLEGSSPTGMLHRSSLFLLPAEVARRGVNTMIFELRDDSSRLFEMSAVFVGPHLNLEWAFKFSRFVSSALVWSVLLGAFLAVTCVVMLVYVGGSRFLLVTIPLSALVVVFAVLQLLSDAWVSKTFHVLVWFFVSIALLLSSFLVSQRSWIRSKLFYTCSAILAGCAGGLLLAFIQAWIDRMELVWGLVLLVLLTMAVIASTLLVAVSQQTLREESRRIDPVVAQVLSSRLVVAILAWVLVLSMLRVLNQVPLVMLNVCIFMMPFNTSMLALLAAIARTQELMDFRENLRDKVASQERHLWSLNHHHLEAMRWTVIGRSALTLVDSIKAPLKQMFEELARLESEPALAANAHRCKRLRRSIDRCNEHVTVIESLIQEDDIHYRTHRLDVLLPRCMARLQESYAFEWELHCAVRGWVAIDEHYLFNVIESLVDNAHHSALVAGRPLVLWLELKREGDDVLVEIEDNGTGIEESVDVFQPFHSSRAFGLGLGVNLAQKHLNAMGGYLSQRPSDRGAKFCIHLPVGVMP